MNITSVTQDGARSDAPNAASHQHGLTLFRGLAILQIACLHASHALFLRGLPGPGPENDPVFVGIDIVFHGSTIYFALISGFLYQHLFSKRPYGLYLRGRMERVALPYLVVTFTLTLAQHPASVRRLSPELLETLIHNILTGATWNTLWYVPVILTIYILAPLLAAMLSRPSFRPLGLALLLAPLVVSRSGTDPSIANLVYFAGAFAVGIELRRANIDTSRNEILILALLIGAAATLILATLFMADVDLVGPVSLRESVFYVQKLALGCAMLSLTQRWAERHGRGNTLLSRIAACSFGIYFLHGPIMRLTAKAVGPYLDGNDFEFLCGILLILLIAIGASLLIIIALQRLFGHRSRWIVGA